MVIKSPQPGALSVSEERKLNGGSVVFRLKPSRHVSQWPTSVLDLRPRAKVRAISGLRYRMGAAVFAQDFQVGSAGVDEGIGAPADDKALFAPYQLEGS